METRKQILTIIAVIGFWVIFFGYFLIVNLLFPNNSAQIHKIAFRILIGLVILCVIVISIIVKFDLLGGKKRYSHYIGEKANKIRDFTVKIKKHEDKELLKYAQEFIDELYDINSVVDDKPIIEYLIDYKRKETLQFWIKNGANINEYEERINLICSKSYTTILRAKEDFKDYFADRI